MINITSVRYEHKDAFKQLISTYQQSDKIACVIGYGSYFSGCYQENSDIDVLMLSHSERYEKKMIMNSGVLFEVFNIGLNRFKHLLESYHECFVQAAAHGEVIFDPSEISYRIRKHAQAIYQAKPGYCHNDKSLNILRSKIRTLWTDMQDTCNTPVHFNVFHQQLLITIYQVLLIQNQEWGRGKKKMFAHIEAMSGDIYQLIIQAFSAESIADKVALTETLIDKLLSPHGGMLKDDEVLLC